MRIAFTTLGCKINQYETDHLRQDLQSRGNTIVPFDGEADVYVINTCSVTGKSDTQSRQIIRSAARRAHGARIIVTGCYASTRPEEIARIPGVGMVIHNRDKAALPDRIMTHCSGNVRALCSENHIPVQSFFGRTRAFLKIQDGCDNRCTHCIVPLARGDSRSALPGDIFKEFDRLVQQSCPEIVLTGIHIGMYGKDLAEKTSLPILIHRLLERRGKTRIRLSSIEANEITDEIITFLGNGLCRHLHIPLQSGDDAILRSMGRNYTSRFYRQLIETISNRVPDIAIGTDIIVGFPGEGEKEFRNTLELVQQTPLTHLHVFTYSPRPGTPAADMTPHVPDAVKKARSELLRGLGAEKNYLFRKEQVGNHLQAVLESSQEARNGELTGLTDNYLKVAVSGVKKGFIGREINVRIEKIEKDKSLAIKL